MGSDSRNQPASERWRRIEDLYHRALERAENQRAEFLEQACGGDEGLRREVESLLGYVIEADGLLKGVAVADSSPESAVDSDLIAVGRDLGSYKVLSLLGTGGMGKVYLGKD